MLDYTYVGQPPKVKQQIVEMAMNASGIRDTARVLNISPTTVINELKKGICTPTGDHAVLRLLNPEHVEVEIWRADALDQRCGLTSELDEMWAVCGQEIESTLVVACN